MAKFLIGPVGRLDLKPCGARVCGLLGGKISLVLVHAFVKKPQKLPGKELQTAVARMKDYL